MANPDKKPQGDAQAKRFPHVLRVNRNHSAATGLFHVEQPVFVLSHNCVSFFMGKSCFMHFSLFSHLLVNLIKQNITYIAVIDILFKSHKFIVYLRNVTFITHH